MVSAGYKYKIPVFPESKIKEINIHPTLLPIGRGPWPLPYIILKNLKSSGVTIHKISEEMDKGDILIQREFEVQANEDIETLSCKSQMIAKKLIIELIQNLDFYYENAVTQGKGEYWHFPTIEEIDKNIVANHKIPFTITDNDPIYSEENIARLKAISKEMKEGKYHELNLDEEV